MRVALPTRRLLVMGLTALLAAAGLASSCSLDAAVSTDRGGRVTGIEALELRSDLLQLAVAVAMEGQQMVFELRWRPPQRESSSLL